MKGLKSTWAQTSRLNYLYRGQNYNYVIKNLTLPSGHVAQPG